MGLYGFMKKLLITGATGFVGYHLVVEALLQGYEVHATIRKSGRLGNLSNVPIHFHELSLFDKEGFKRLLNEHQIGMVIHNAGLTKATTEDQYFSVNTHGTRVLAEALSESNSRTKRFIFMSSLAAKGPGKNPGDLLYQHTPDQPVTAYGRSKLRAERVLMEIPHLDVTIFRPTGVFGPYEQDFLQMIKMIHQGIEVYIGKQDQTISFLYVKDLSRLVIHALAYERMFGPYMVSDGNVYSRYTFGEVASNLLQKKTRRICIPLIMGKGIAILSEYYHQINKKPALLNRDKLHEILAPSWLCDISYVQRDFNFAMQYQLASGLQETLKWYKENHWL